MDQGSQLCYGPLRGHSPESRGCSVFPRKNGGIRYTDIRHQEHQAQLSSGQEAHLAGRAGALADHNAPSLRCRAPGGSASGSRGQWFEQGSVRVLLLPSRSTGQPGQAGTRKTSGEIGRRPRQRPFSGPRFSILLTANAYIAKNGWQSRISHRSITTIRSAGLFQVQYLKGGGRSQRGADQAGRRRSRAVFLDCSRMPVGAASGAWREQPSKSPADDPNSGLESPGAHAEPV